VSAYGELGAQREHEQALRWLENLPAPEIKADLCASFRSSSSYFVPVNDQPVNKHKGRSDFRPVIDRRSRQERFFPAAVPTDPVIVFQWPQTPGLDEHRATLGSLVENLTYIGHSSSPVRACLRERLVEPSLCPSQDGDVSLRVPSTGRFDRLQSTHELRRADESVQPPLGRLQAYQSQNLVPQSVFSRNALVVALEGGPRLGLDSTLPLMQHVRNALLARLGSSAPELLSGHAIRYVDRFAHGELKSLDFSAYARASGTWASVTPVVLDRHPKGNGRSVESVVAMACERIGLPAPVEIRVGFVSAVTGAPRDRDFHGSAKQVDNRQRRHVVIRFRERVRGPVMLGAGRFAGLGLCVPLRTSHR
jgi:hypothetical protein